MATAQDTLTHRGIRWPLELLRVGSVKCCGGVYDTVCLDQGHNVLTTA
jgi:hypothetical protein